MNINKINTTKELSKIIEEALMISYRKAISDNIKRGIREKKRLSQNSKVDM